MVWVRVYMHKRARTHVCVSVYETERKRERENEREIDIVDDTIARLAVSAVFGRASTDGKPVCQQSILDLLNYIAMKLLSIYITLSGDLSQWFSIDLIY